MGWVIKKKSYLFVVVKLLLLSTMDDLMHYCTRPHAIVHQVVQGTSDNSFDYTTNRYEITVYYSDSLAFNVAVPFNIDYYIRYFFHQAQSRFKLLIVPLMY